MLVGSHICAHTAVFLQHSPFAYWWCWERTWMSLHHLRWRRLAGPSLAPPSLSASFAPSAVSSSFWWSWNSMFLNSIQGKKTNKKKNRHCPSKYRIRYININYTMYKQITGRKTVIPFELSHLLSFKFGQFPFHFFLLIHLFLLFFPHIWFFFFIRT